jgi:ABC-2 type transport system ATP-binding protein
MFAIRTENLKKRFGRFFALNGVSINVPMGKVYSLLGPNGAGKTTTVEVLNCILKHDYGKVQVLGLEIPKDCKEIRKRTGVLPQEYNGFTDLTVKENIEYFAKIYGDSKDHVKDIMRLINIEDLKDKKFGKLSGGQKRKVGIACALVGNPEIIFLDEPTLGLDPLARRNLWEIIKDLRKNGITIFMTTHYMEEAEVLSDIVAIIDKGVIIEEGNPKDIIGKLKVGNLEEAYITIIGDTSNER